MIFQKIIRLGIIPQKITKVIFINYFVCNTNTKFTYARLIGYLLLVHLENDNSSL